MDFPTRPKRSLLAHILLTPNENRLRSGWRLMGQQSLMGITTLALVLPVGLIIGLLPIMNLVETLPEAPVSTQILLIGGVVHFLAITVSVVLARYWLDRRSFSSLGLQVNQQARADLWMGISLSGLMLGFIFLVEWGMGWLKITGFAWQQVPPTQMISSTLMMLVAFVTVGWYEELLFRGYWLQNLSEGLNRFWGVLLSSIFFAAAHLLNPNISASAIVGLTLFGILAAYAYLRTSQLWLPIGLHIGWNFFESTVFGFPVSGFDLFRLIHAQVQGPPLWTGGGFGPEAGLVLIPTIALGTLLVYRYSQQYTSRG